MDISEKLIDFEMRLAYMEDIINTLDAVITRQGEDIDTLLKTNKLLSGKLDSLNDQVSASKTESEDEPPPPHY